MAGDSPVSVLKISTKNHKARSSILQQVDSFDKVSQGADCSLSFAQLASLQPTDILF